MLLELALALTLSPAPLAPAQEAVAHDRVQQRIQRLRERATQLEQGTAPEPGSAQGLRRGDRQRLGRDGLGQGRVGRSGQGARLGQGEGARGRTGQASPLTPKQRAKLRAKIAKKLRERGRRGRAGEGRGGRRR